MYKVGDKVKSSQYPHHNYFVIVRKDKYRNNQWQIKTADGNNFYQPEKNLTIIL